jgi:leucyl aminopeptidase
MFTQGPVDTAIPLHLVTERELDVWRTGLPGAWRDWTLAGAFAAERHKVCLLPAPSGELGAAAVGLGGLANIDELTMWHVAGLSDRLPAGTYRVARPLTAGQLRRVAQGWAYGRYRYTRYRKGPVVQENRLLLPPEVDRAEVERIHAACSLARDLINTPASDMNPVHIADAITQTGEAYGARTRIVSGDALLEAGFPAIHSVGRASAIAPRLVDLTWGDPAAPRITLVGKGVTFDSGGLDLKPPASMLLMKKDMGGAACATALAQLVMSASLPVRLRLIVPAVENAIAGNAYRPGDIIATRKGLTVEVGNTDAEGRLVLADALALAQEEQPEVLIDFATLTGAARAALGPELPALFCDDDAMAAAVLAHAALEADPLWRMPLWSGYDEDLTSRIADVNNVAGHSFAGAILAALFLRRFAGGATGWMHVDLYAWNGKDRPGRPVGAEAQAVRALYSYVRERFH